MALERPLYMQPGPGDPAIQYTAQQDRAGLLGMTFSREGVHDLRGGHLRVTQRAAGANFTVDVAPGRCAIQGDDISDQGMYICNSTTTVSLTVPAKPASGTRNHRVVARIRDKLSSGTWSQYDWVLEILADTGSGTPALPNTAITLAIITVSNATVSITNGNITDSRSRASTGTAALTGSFNPYQVIAPNNQPYWVASDTNRPLRWSVNPDGWVQLSGFITRRGDTSAVAAGSDNIIVTETLDSAVRPANASYRDFLGMTREGPCQMTIKPAGYIALRVWSTTTFTKDGTWVNFDGCGYQL